MATPRLLWGLVLWGTGLAGAQAGEAFLVSGAAGYTSRYVSEGRDNLPEGGMWTAEAGVSGAAISAAAWYGRAETGGYEELNLSVAYGLTMGDWQAAFGYTHLSFLETDETDQELSVELVRELAAGLLLTVAGVYSVEAEGSFVEVSLSREFLWEGSRYSLLPYLLEGFDFGYASDTYDGPNHLQAGLILSCQLCDTLSLSAEIAHSWAHGDVRRDGSGDVAWFAFGLAADF